MTFIRWQPTDSKRSLLLLQYQSCAGLGDGKRLCLATWRGINPVGGLVKSTGREVGYA
jgi:hypothetical protein